MTADELSTPPSRDASWGHIATVLCDLDGVVWLAHEPIDGAVDAIAALRATGRRVVFVTNNSAATVSEHVGALERIGVPAAGDVVSSSMAAASLVERDQRVLVAGGPGVVEAVAAQGAVVVLNTGDDLDEPVDVVIVGLHRDFDYGRLRVAGRAVLDGARLIGTNADTTYPTPSGLEPGGGSILAAVATVAGVTPVVAGKPEAPMAAVVRGLVTDDSSDGAAFDPSSTIVVGDRPETDGAFAAQLACAFALVESGVTRPGDVVDAAVPIALRVSDLAALAARILRG